MKKKKEFDVDGFVKYFLIGFFITIGFFVLAYTVMDSTEKRATPDQIELVVDYPEVTGNYKYNVYEHNQFTNTYYLDKVIPAYGVQLNIQKFKYESYVYTEPIFKKDGKLYVRNR